MKKNGFTLVEVILAAGISVIVIGAALFLMQELFSSQMDMQKRLNTLIDVSLLRLKLGREVGGGQLRSFIFTGQGEIQPGDVCSSCVPAGGDQPLGRFIVPLGGKCRDLSACADTTTLLFASQRKQRLTISEALCFIDSGRVLVRSPEVVGPIISLIGPPNSTLWRVQGPPAGFTVNPGTGAPLSSDCVAALRRINNGNIPPGPYFALTIKPVVGELFTGSNCVCESQIARAINFFPAPIVDVEIFSVGIQPQPTDFNWGMNQCALAADAKTLDCTRETGFLVEGVLKAEIHEEFEVNDPARPTIRWFALLKAGSPLDTRLCEPADCAVLPLPALMRTTNAGESFENLDFQNFSLLKQEVLRRIRFQVRRTDGRQLSAEVQF